MKFLLPQGVGDNFWVLSKIESVAKRHEAKSIDVLLNCGDPSQVTQIRALEFVRRFKCVTSAEMYVAGNGTFLKPGPIADADGYFRYLDDGPTELPGVDFVMIPNGALEKGVRLENWLPEYEIDWEFARKQLSFTDAERKIGAAFAAEPFVALHLGCKSSNTYSGHNRGPLWHPADWIELGRHLQNLGLRLVVFGADYDRDYFNELIKPIVGDSWIDAVGRWTLMETFAVLQQAKFMISYQCGLAMVPTYLGVKTVIFWRPHGDSLLPTTFVSCHEGMATGWVPPKVLAAGDYIPAFYGRHGVDWIMGEITARGWTS